MYEPLLEALESGSTVVTANNRLARTLQHAFDCRQLAAGLSAWRSPDVLSWSAWLHRLWTESRLRGGEAQRTVLLDEPATAFLWQQSIAALEKDRVSLPLGQYSRGARNAWKLLNDWDALTAEEWASAGLTPDQQAFLRWSGEFRSRCEAAGWVDADQLVARLGSDVAVGLFDDLAPLCFAGFDAWPPARKALRESLEVRDISVRTDLEPPLQTHVRSVACASQDAELLAAARWARGCLEQTPEWSVGIVVPDLAARADEVRRVFQDVFVPDWRVSGLPSGLPLNVSYGRPLAAMPLVHSALLLFRLAEGRAGFNDFSLLLRCRWLEGADDEASARALLEVELRDRVRIEFALADVLPRCRKFAPRFARLVEQLVECSQQRSRRTPAEWAHFLTDLLEQAGWPGAANLDSEAWQTLRSWNELLAAFAGTHTVLGELTRREALAALSQLAEQRLFQPEGAADGVQVMGVLEAAGHCFDRLWVTGMARELWPRSGRPDAFIPLKLQRRLGLPDSSADTVLGYATQLTQRLLASATEVIVSWPEQLEGESLTASPLLANIETTSGLTADAVPLWNQQALAAVRTELLGADAPPPWRGSGRVRGGVSVLNRQATSPLNAFIEKRLGAAELRRPPVGIDAMRRGNLTHKVLEEFYTAHPSHPAVAALTPADRRAALTAQLENALQALPGIHEAFMRKLADFELVQQLQRLEAFIELDLRREDFKVSACEVPTEVQIGPLMLKLKLDRLDTLPNGRQLVIDYKTGRVNRQDWNPNNPRDLQLPLYVTAIVPDADAVSFAQVSVHGVRFDGVGSGESGVEGIRSPGRQARVQVKYQQPHTDKLIESWDELRHVWAELLVELADKFVAGDFRLDPRNPESARGQFAVLSRVYDEGSGLLEDDA